MKKEKRLHERFITTANGIFSLSKDIDLFSSNNGKFIPKKVKFGYHSDFHPFLEKHMMINLSLNHILLI